MSRIHVCLFVFFFVLNIAVQFGDCEDTTDSVNCDEKVSPGSDKTHMSILEKFLKKFHKPKNTTEGIARSFISSLNKFREEFNDYEFKMIFPGTLWCGDGDRAKNKDDLGKFNKTDTCCRAHDNCKNGLAAGEIEVNIKNNGIFTRSACACDNAFYKCLKNADTILSRGIGRTYFNLLGQQCFKCVCPTDDCNASTDSSECKGQCGRYAWVNSSRF